VVGGVTPACTVLGALFYSQVLDHVVPVSSTSVAEMVTCAVSSAISHCVAAGSGICAPQTNCNRARSTNGENPIGSRPRWCQSP
jgi:hypothetical protein